MPWVWKTSVKLVGDPPKKVSYNHKVWVKPPPESKKSAKAAARDSKKPKPKPKPQPTPLNNKAIQLQQLDLARSKAAVGAPKQPQKQPPVGSIVPQRDSIQDYKVDIARQRTPSIVNTVWDTIGQRSQEFFDSYRIKVGSQGLTIAQRDMNDPVIKKREADNIRAIRDRAIRDQTAAQKKASDSAWLDQVANTNTTDFRGDGLKTHTPIPDDGKKIESLYDEVFRATDKGAAIDPAYIEKLDKAWQNYVENVALTYNRAVDEVLVWWRVDDEGNLVLRKKPKKGMKANIERAEAALSNEALTTAGAEYTRLMGGTHLDKKGNTVVDEGLLKAWGDKRENLAKVQRDRLFKEAQDTVFNTTRVQLQHGDIRGAIATVREAQGTQYMFDAAKDTIDPARTGWTWSDTPDPVTGRRERQRTVEEEFEYRRTLYMAEMERQIKEAEKHADLQRLSRILTDNGYAAKDLPGIAAIAKQFGYNDVSSVYRPQDVEKIVDRAMLDWDDTNRRIYLGPGFEGLSYEEIAKRLRTSVSPWNPNQYNPKLLEYATARRAVVDRYYNYFGMQERSLFDRPLDLKSEGGGSIADNNAGQWAWDMTLGKLPDMLNSVLAPLGVTVGGLNTAATAAAGAPTNWLGAWDNLDYKKFPREQQKKVDALVQTIMNDPTWFSRHPEFGHAPPIAARGIYREKALAAALHIVAKEFMKTPEGDKWSIDRNQMTGGLGWTTGRNSEERAEFLKEGQSFWDNFYGEGGDKVKGLAEASTSLFTEDSAAYEMIVGFGLDPLNLIPMNALTYVARSKYAINALKTLPGKQKALAPWKWITVSDAELKVGRAFKKLATRLDAGEDPNKIVAEFAELLSGVHGKSQQERMVKDFFIKYGINPRNASEHQFFTLVQDLAAKMAEVKKIPIESVAAVARKKNEALIAAREAARAADPKIVAADAAHAAKVAAAELEVKAGAAHVESVVTVRSRLQGRAERLATQRSERIAAQPAPSVHVPHEPVAGASPAEVVSTQVPYSPDPVVAAVQKANRDRAFKRVPFTRRGIPIVRRTGSRTPDASPRTVFEDDAFSTGRDTILDREPTFSMRQGTEILYGETFRMGGAEKFLKTPAGVRVTEIIGLAEPTDPLAKPLWEAQRLEAAMIIREEAKRSMSEFEREMEGIAGHLNARGELIFDRGAVVDSERSAANQFIPDRSAVWDRGGVRDELSGEQLNHAMVKWQETKVALLRLQQSHEAGRLTDEQFRERYLEMLGESYFSYGNTRINYGDILLNDLHRRRADAALDAARGRIRPKVVEWQKYITKISDAYEDYVKRAEATRETIEAGAQDALRRGQHPGDVARARAKKLEELRKAEMRNAEIYRDAMSDALSEERALLASVDPVLPTFTGSDLNNMYSTFTLLREFGDDAPIDEFKYRVYGAMDPMDPDFRDGFSAVQFAKHFRANFMIPPSGPDDFRERGDFLFRLFHMTLLDTGSKHSGRMDEYRRVIEGILSEPGPKKGEVFDAVEGTNGLTASLDTLYRRTFTTPADQTVFARMWQVMETRAGLPGSATFIGAEDAFIESIMRSGIEPTLHPTLALMTIPHGPIARKVPTSFGLPRLLAEIPYSKSKNNLFSAPPIGYDDVFALADIKRIGSGAVKDVYEGVRLAAHVIQYQALRLGGPKRRASFNARLEGWGVHNALLDVHVRKPVPDGAPRGTQGDLLLPQNAEGVEELRRRWIARAEAEHPSSTPEALFARRAQFDKLFDDQMKTIAPKKGETRLVRNPDYTKDILKDFVELYWEGKISVANPSIHTLMLYTKLLDPHVQRGTQWEKFYRVYMRNMTQIGHKDVADEVAGWIFLPQRKSRMHTAWESIYGIEGKAAAKDDAWQQEGKDIFEEFGLAPSRESLIERVKNTTIVDSAEAEKGNAAMRDDFAAAGKRKGEDESAGHFTEGSIEEASDRVMAGIENLRAGIPTDPVLRLEADAADLIPVKGEWDPVLDEVFMEMAREKGWDVTRINAARFSSAPGVRPGGGRLTNEWMDFYERVAPQIYEEAQLREIRGGLASLVRRTNGVTGLTDESEQLLKDTIAAVHGLGDEGDKILRSLGNAQGEFIVDSRIGQILAHHDFFAPRVAPAWVERKARREITALIGAERQRLTALGHTAEDLKDLHVDRPGDVRKRMAEGVDIDRAPDRGRPKPDSVPKDDPRRLAAKAYLGRVKAVHLSNIKRAKRISELEALLKRGRIVNHKRVAVTPARKKVIEAAIASLKSAEGTLHSSVKIEPLQHTVDAHGVVKSISATLPPRPSATQVRELQTLEKRLAAAEAEYKRLQAMRKRGDAIPAGPRPTTTSIKKMRDEIAAMKVKHEEMLNLRADVQGLLEEIKNFEAMTKIEVYSKELTAAMKEANDDEAMAILRKIDEAAALLPDTQKTRVRQVVEEVREDLTSVENPPPAAEARPEAFSDAPVNIGDSPAIETISETTLADGRIVRSETVPDGPDRIVVVKLDDSELRYRISPREGYGADTSRLSVAFEKDVSRVVDELEDAVQEGRAPDFSRPPGRVRIEPLPADAVVESANDHAARRMEAHRAAAPEPPAAAAKWGTRVGSSKVDSTPEIPLIPNPSTKWSDAGEFPTPDYKAAGGHHPDSGLSVYTQFDYPGRNGFQSVHHGPKVHLSISPDDMPAAIAIIDRIARAYGLSYKYISRIEHMMREVSQATGRLGSHTMQDGKSFALYLDAANAREIVQEIGARLEEAGIRNWESVANDRQVGNSPIWSRWSSTYSPKTDAEKVIDNAERYTPDGGYGPNTPDPFVGLGGSAPPVREPNSVEMLGREHDQIEQDMMDSAREGYEGRIPTAEEDLGAEDWVPPVPPTQASLTPSGLSRRQRTLNLLSGMSEEEWLNYQLLLAKRQRDRAKTGAKRHAAWIRIKHIKQAQLVAELSRTGMPYYQYASRRRYARLAIDVLLPHVEGTISPQRITSYFSNPAAIAIERGRVENRMRKRAVVISGGAAPDRTTGVSANYTSMSAASHATVEKDFLTPLRPDQLSAAGLGPEWTGMSPLSILHSADEMIPAVRDTRFRKWLSHLEGRMQMHLDRYSGDPNYSVKQYLADRTNHGDVLGEAFERGDAAIVAAREAAGLPKRRTWTDLPYQRGEPGAPEPDEVGFELIDNDPREIVAKARALAEQKIDLHEYNETRKVLRPGLVRELAAKRIQKEMYPLIFADLERLGVRIDDRVRWDKEWQKSWDFHLDEIRNRMAREETYSKLGQFAFEEGFDRPLAQLLRDFEALYGLTNEILPGKPLEISHFQKRTLDRAVEAHLGIDSVDDPDALMIGLRRHGQHPPDFDNRGSRREWLVKYGFFTPRTKEMIESGKKSWSIEDEAQWWDDNWGYIPPDTDPALYAEGGPRNGIAHDEIEYLDQMKADGVYKTNMQARYAQSTMSREERIKLYVYGDKTLEIEPSRDLELERRYVFERFGDLFSEEMSDGSRRLKAFPWLMNESEYRGYVMERTGKGIADELLQDVFELHEVTRAINVALNPRLDAILKRGTPMTHEDVLTMCVEITEELLKNPEWLRRSRDVGGDFIRLQGKVRRGLVMTMFGFGTTNFLDSGIRTGWMAFRDRGIMTPPHLQSAFAGSLELAHAGLEHGTQLVRTRVDLGTTRIWKGWHGDHPILDTITGIGTIPLQMSAAAERAGKLRLLRGMYDEVYALALREISDPDIAKLAALKECGDRIAKMWPTAGDSSVSRLWNDLFPFFSYQFKNHVLFLGELATHPVLYNHLQRIGDYIESVNTQNWINSHPKDQPPDPKLMRLIELPWAPGEFIDFGEWTDFQRGVKPAYDVIEGKATPKSLVSQFVRLVSANDQNMFSGVLNALHLGQKKMWLEIMGEDGWGTGEFEWVEVPIEAPWGGVANAFFSIWPLQMASDWIEAQKDGNVSVQELTRIAYSFMFMGSLKSYDKTAALNAYYMTLPSKYAKEQFLLTDNGKILKNWWQDSAAQPNFLKYPKELKEIMDPNIHVDPNPWFHAKSPEYQSAVKRALSEKWSMMRSWDHKISQLMPGSKELRDAKLQRATEYYAFYGTHPILYEYDAFSMTPDEWAAKTDQFQTDLLVETFFNIKAPLRDDFASEEAYQRALANWKRARAIFLGAFPKVAEALQGSKNALEMQQAGQEEGWFRVLEEIGTRDIAMQAAREAEDFPLLDQLYIVKNLQFAKLEEEQIGFYFNETTDYKQIEVFGREVKVKASPSLIPHVRILPDFNAWRWERANAEKRQEILDKKRYGQGMAKVIFKAKKAKNFGASFVRQLKKDPWLLEQYFAQPGNENKKAEWALNDKYISIISRYGKLMEAGRFDAGYAYFESMPDWVKVRYFDAHPGRAKKMAETQEYMRWMKKWIAFFKRRDYEGGSAFFDTMPKWVQERYRKNNPKYGDAKGGSSPYSRAMGGWVQLLKDGKKDEAKKYFDALPQEFKDRYYSNHPEARLRDDLKRIGQLAYYFGADDANRAQYLENNPEFAKWLKNNTKSAEQRKMLITAAYRSIPKEDEWLRRVFRERYPEVFSLGAIGQAKLAKVDKYLAEHPEMNPIFEKWVNAILASYAEEQKHVKAAPRPLVKDYSRQQQHGVDRRVPPHKPKSAAWVRLHSI